MENKNLNSTKAQLVNQLIRDRRSIFPKTYIDKEIPKAVIEEILENANCAPTHKFTEPWRFRIFRGDSLKKLSGFLGNWYESYATGDKYSAKKHEKTKNKPLQSSCVIAICMQRDPQERIPEWEELAAVSCAVQNMWLSCTAYDIGCYWSSPMAIHASDDFLELQEGEKCLGFFYMGYHKAPKTESKRQAIQDKTKWM